MREDSEYFDEIESVLRQNKDFKNSDNDRFIRSIYKLVNYVKEQVERGSCQYHLDLGARLGSIEAKIEQMENGRVMPPGSTQDFPIDLITHNPLPRKGKE